MPLSEPDSTSGKSIPLWILGPLVTIPKQEEVGHGITQLEHQHLF